MCISIIIWMMGRVRNLESNVFEYSRDGFRVIFLFGAYMYI